MNASFVLANRDQPGIGVTLVTPITEAKRLSKLGGQYRAPQASDDRTIMADEDAVALMRDLPEALTEFVQEF
ncbi:hypothetical protein [Botrimarina mediterranea]|uniref:hypothetical protein n=1 Tax=Botrimarina mediterranea TaxID=2528022 RepID=UPI0011A02159